MINEVLDVMRKLAREGMTMIRGQPTRWGLPGGGPIGSFLWMKAGHRKWAGPMILKTPKMNEPSCSCSKIDPLARKDYWLFRYVHESNSPIHRASAGPHPTPLDPLPRFSKKLGIDLYVKRDDLTGRGVHPETRSGSSNLSC